jgi:hypothetical protein
MPGVLPVVMLPLAALLLGSSLPRWGLMWATAFALYAGCKWLTYCEARLRGLGRGWRGWLFTVVVAAVPAFWLFPPPFVQNVILPMLAFIGAL